jgi:hypothetical protein
MTRHLLIIGGGVAGLSAGCYALRSGFGTTIVEHNLALGGVCTAWHRGKYTIDGCIQWLTGGPFRQLRSVAGIQPLRPVIADRNIRVPIGLTVHALAAFAIALLVPSLSLVVPPIVLGVPHVASDIRYLVLRRNLPASWPVIPVMRSEMTPEFDGEPSLGPLPTYQSWFGAVGLSRAPGVNVRRRSVKYCTTMNSCFLRNVASETNQLMIPLAST